MANRYIDTNFFRSPYVRGLKGQLKTLYCFIICDCSNSGIWIKDLEAAKMYTGFKLTEADFKIFISSGKAIDMGNGKFFFPDFIEHQYPKGLSRSNPAHTKIIEELTKNKLLNERLEVLPSPSQGTKVEVMVKEEGKEEVEVGDPEVFKAEIIHPLQKFISENCPNISKLRDQLTYDEATALMANFNSGVIEDVLQAMENYQKLLKNYVSVYLTMNNWCKKRKNDRPNNNNSKGSDSKGGYDIGAVSDLLKIA